MLRWDDFYDNLPTPEQPLQLLPESPASDKSFTLTHIPQPFDESPSNPPPRLYPFDESPISSDPTNLKPLPASLWIDSDELDQYGINDDIYFFHT